MYDIGGYAEAENRGIRNGMTREHKIEQMWDPNKRFGSDRKNLIQELEDESDTKDTLPLSCAWICNRDQFLCTSSCTCISLDARCDGQVIKFILFYQKILSFDVYF